MSYDIALYRRALKSDTLVRYNYDGNMTWNVREMLTVAFGENHLKKWNNLKVSEFIEDFKKGYQDMILNPSKYKQYDSPNGWRNL